MRLRDLMLLATWEPSTMQDVALAALAPESVPAPPVLGMYVDPSTGQLVDEAGLPVE